VLVLDRRELGASGIDVSVLSLGSWRTFERIPREQGLAVMHAAREHGIAFLDDARYDDETGNAPLATGYSEIVFGELFRAAGWNRDEVVVANKLWWEFWPRQSAAEELDGSLARMRLDHLDLVYAATPPDDLPVADVVGAASELVAAGKARSWGVLNWPPHLLAEAAAAAQDAGLPPPCATQVAYNLAVRDTVEGPDAAAALEAAGASVVASMPLWFGALTGKYANGGAEGRLAGSLDEPRHRDALALAEPLRELAARFGATPAALAVAFALSGPRVASVLFGATRPEQVAENAAAVDAFAALGDAGLAELRALGATR
jgi:aryl-alcohol dehydrogenase-like predicted oxidoreductase